MNGAEALVRTSVAAGVEICFANPGTTELQLVEALDGVPGVRAVLGLFEGVCSGAADGYARMSGRPAAVLTHLGPGFANSIANLHNARRARSPVVNWIGDHASWHRPHDAPLCSDIASLAAPVSAWLRTSESAELLARDGAEAVAAALGPPGGVASLIVPQDCTWNAASGPVPPTKPAAPGAVPAERIEAAASALGAGPGAVLFLGGAALRGTALDAAARIAAATGCALLHETFTARLERGAGRPRVERLPYFPEQASERLAGFESLIRVSAPEPVAFFGYRDGPSRLCAATTQLLALAEAEEDVGGALEALAERVGAPARSSVEPAARPEAPGGALSVGSLGQALAALQPEGAVVVDEGATSGLAYDALAAGAPDHDCLALTGGAIGQGLPAAVGAALACPERPVVALQADGGGMYTLQALWTAARESLDLVIVIAANRAYRILQAELGRAGVAAPGPAARSLTELTRPELDWTALARGHGVPGVRVDSADGFCDAFRRALAEPGPHLIEAVLG